MVAAECIKRIECNNCEVKFTLTFDKEEIEDSPDYCPFCGDLVEDVYKDIEDEDDDWSDGDEW
jgi:primosomal protein N'